MKILAKQNRELIMTNAQNTQNENDAEKITLQVPEQYEDFNKKIVFVTPDGNVWDIITNNEYLIPKAITKYKQVDLYIWLTKGDVDFRSQTRTLKFYHNVDASGEITPEEISGVNTVVNLLEEEITKVENLESQIDGKLEEVDTAIDNIHTAIQETENLNLDAEKVGQTTTITLTKKDGTTKTVHVDDGVDLQFMWQGTSLGIKTAEQEEYTFVDLQGVQGQRGEQGEPFTIKKTYSSVAEMNADFNNMQLGDYVMIASTVEVEDNAKLYTRGENQWIFITDFSGATGIRGEVGLTPNIQIGTVTQGTSFNVTRTGTNENPVLNFTLVKGDKGERGIQGIQGLTGNGIASITKTGTDGLVDTYTITYTNGNTTTFTITNGEDGEVTETELNVLRQKLEDQQKVINQLPQVEGQGTEVTLENTIEAPFTKFDVEGNSDQETTVGKQLIGIADGTYTSTNNAGSITFKDGIGKVTIASGTSSSFGISIPLIKPVILKANQAYTRYNNSGNAYPYISLSDSERATIDSMEVSDNGLKVYTPTEDKEVHYIFLWFSIQSYGDIKPMMVEGSYTASTMPAFEKFTYGASPNPLYPQEIKSCGENVNEFDGELERNAWENSNGTYTVYSNQYVRSKNFTEVKNNTTYTIDFSIEDDSRKRGNILSYDENKSFLNSIELQNNLTFSTSANTKYLKFNFFATNAITVESVKNIKLEQGNKATPYSPYGMGSINEKISNKNVWNIDKFKNLYGTNTYETYNNVECLKLAGATQRYNFDGKENTQYTFQFKLIGSTLNSEIGAFSLVYSDGTSDYHAGILTPKTYTFTSKANKTLVRIVWNAWNAGNFIYIDKNSMQLEPGSTATPYVPHKEQDYSIFVQQPMRSIGDVRDDFVRDEQGNWFERHKIGETILDDTANITRYEQDGIYKYYFNDIAVAGKVINSFKKLCNYAYWNNYISGQWVKNGFGYHLGAKSWVLSTNVIATLEELKTALSNEPLVTNYILQDPTLLPCTEEQIQQLENLPSTYKDFTIIQSEDETPAYLEVSGIYDLNNLINN